MENEKTGSGGTSGETDTYRIGLISDTHGQLRKSAIAALKGVDRIIHAGDIDFMGILDKLSRIAPVHAVRGNMDKHNGLRHLPAFDIIEVGRVGIGIIHDREQLDLDPAAAGLSVVVYGHTHRPAKEERDGVLFINPGSAGPRRFKLPISMGCLHINGETVTTELIELEK